MLVRTHCCNSPRSSTFRSARHRTVLSGCSLFKYCIIRREPAHTMMSMSKHMLSLTVVVENVVCYLLGPSTLNIHGLAVMQGTQDSPFTCMNRIAYGLRTQHDSNNAPGAKCQKEQPKYDKNKLKVRARKQQKLLSISTCGCSTCLQMCRCEAIATLCKTSLTET